VRGRVEILKMFEWILDLIFPRKCVFCRRIPAAKEFPEKDVLICRHCLEKYGGNSLAVGQTVIGPGKVLVDGIYTALEYSDAVRNAMLRFKFNGYDFYAKTFAYSLMKAVEPEMVDVIVPVPLSGKRLRERGYNQAELIGKELSAMTGLPMCTEALVKVKEIPRQSQSKGEERLENVKGAFGLADSAVADVAGKRVLLLDDVLTTGSTLGECAKMLYEAGATKVYCATVTMARRK